MKMPAKISGADFLLILKASCKQQKFLHHLWEETRKNCCVKSRPSSITRKPAKLCLQVGRKAVKLLSHL